MPTQVEKDQGIAIEFALIFSHGKEKEMMPKMLDFLLDNFFSEIASLEKDKGLSREECYLEMYYEIVRRTAVLVALWQSYGFCHGVKIVVDLSEKIRF